MTAKSAALNVVKIEGKSPGYAVARSELEPGARHAALAINASADLFAGDTANVTEMAEAMQDMAAEAGSQDMSGINRLLTAQALSLDALFTQMARKAHANLGNYPDAVDRYLRLALKAQAQSRATLETLAKIVQPREQTVRHIHVGPDGQDVFIENYNGGIANARFDGRAHTAPETSFAGERTSLPCPDPLGSPLPVTGGEGQESVPHARGRNRKRGSIRQ